MVSKILGNIPFRETKFKIPPKTTYAVYNDSKDVGGSDSKNLLIHHDITIELYAYELDKQSEILIENNFDALGIHYVKQERFWIDTEKLYQTIYEFDYITKKGD